MSTHAKDKTTGIPRTIRTLAVPIILIWVAYTAAVNLLVPQVEKVGMANAVSMSPQDAPAVIAAKRMGAKFQESTSDSIAMVVLVGDEPLGEDALPFSFADSRAPERRFGPAEDFTRTATANYIYQRVFTILGGTTEIQKNIIAKSILGLPS